MLYVLKVTLSRNSLSKEIRIRQIEIALTSKHLATWDAFRTSNFDFLLVMEADATWNESQKDALSKVLGALAQENLDYLNIAGGLSLEDLQVDRLISNKEIIGGQEFLTFSKPVTNTNCAYIINRPLVKLLLDRANDPSNREGEQLGADWFMNDLFIKICGRGHKIRSQHFSPPLLMHGSMSGVSVSWHPDRR
jgi:GR25 family glycosyltransferase involved in LPS biosynthesis